jgi:hypothetical protein
VKIDLCTREGYDIAGAIRGPDPYLNGLKFVFTARIRFWVCDPMSCGVVRKGGLDATDVELALADVDCIGDRSDVKHWLWHVHDALMFLKHMPGYEGERDEIEYLLLLAERLIYYEWDAAKELIRGLSVD